MKVVIDTNIYLSGLVFPDSKPAQILNLAKKNKFSVYCSPFIISEIRRNLASKFNYNNRVADIFIGEILKYVNIIIPEKKTSLIKAKKDDNFVLDCAIAAKADFLISGDKKHILPIKIIAKTKIISAAEFIQKYQRQNP